MEGEAGGDVGRENTLHHRGRGKISHFIAAKIETSWECPVGEGTELQSYNRPVIALGVCNGPHRYLH